MNRLIKILLLLPTLYLVMIPAFFAHRFYSERCSRIKITIVDSSRYHFVTKRDIQNTIYSVNGSILGKPVKDLSVSGIETTMTRYGELRTAEAYVSIDGTLHIYADQRTPIMRLMPDNGGDYYVDVDGVVVRRRNLYTPRLHIVGGNININQAMLNGVSVLDTSIKNSVLKDIFYLVRYINRDDFWSAQIDQIFVDNNDEIDLIPRVGNHIVHLGTAENFEGKLSVLETFYDKVLPEVGWNKYSVINLAYRDQVVCRRR
ncbi:MAG: cell division protein FtsQ/DivIB [Bacteroidota bacterium]|nr:cell division protein FtsQ/DivIB [Bacteroidota bacterium]